MTGKNTLVIGASNNPERYSYLAIKMLRSYKHTVFAIGNKEAMVEDVSIVRTTQTLANVDTVTLYLNAKLQQHYYDYIINLKPKRVIFNPGTENPEFEELLTKNNIAFIEACTLVLLKTNQF